MKVWNTSIVSGTIENDDLQYKVDNKLGNPSP